MLKFLSSLTEEEFSLFFVSVIVFQSPSHGDLNFLRSQALQHAKLLCLSVSSGACSKSCPLSWWCHPTISSCHPLPSCLQYFPASGSFPISGIFPLGCQSIGASASVLPVNIQDLFPFSSVQFSHSVVADSLRPHESQHATPPCPSPTPRIYPNSRPSNWWCHPTISSCHPLLLLPSTLPPSGSFLMSWLFKSRGQSTGASPSSILPMNIQDWLTLGLTGWISLQSKGLSRVFSNIILQTHQFLDTQPSLWSSSHIHASLLEKPVWATRPSLVGQLVGQLVKNPTVIRETWVQSLGWEDPLEKGMATHSSILSWRSPWTI